VICTFSGINHSNFKQSSMAFTLRGAFRQYVPKRWSEFLALLSLSTTFFLFLQTRDLSMQLSEERTRNTVDGEEFMESGTNLREGDVQYLESGNGGKGRPIHRDLSTAQERELYGKLDPMELNNTRKAKKEILFFNRVPKVGSQTTMELLKSLSIKNNFHYHKDRTQKVETIKLTYNEEKKLSNLVGAFQPASVYVKHVCFTNFTKFNLDMPIYVNMVRDPVERVISWYYYVRAPWYFVERKRAFPDLPLPNPNWLRKVRIIQNRLSDIQYISFFILINIVSFMNVGYRF